MGLGTVQPLASTPTSSVALVADMTDDRRLQYELHSLVRLLRFSAKMAQQFALFPHMIENLTELGDLC